MADERLHDTIAEAFDTFRHQEGARQRAHDFATHLVRELADAGWRIEAAPPEPQPYKVEQCRSCAAPIIWTVTTSLRSMPVDPEPVADGNILLEARTADQPPFAHVLSVAQRFGRTGLRKAHFVTCPHANLWRRPKAAT